MFERSFIETMHRPYEVEQLHQNYITAKPFPHIVLDHCFSDCALYAILQNFPKPDSSWWKYDNVLERKFAKDDLSEEHFTIQEAIALMQARRFTTFLEQLTGIQGLIVDQTLRGGGLHQIARGGKLDVHCDHNFHGVTNLDRRINVLLYLNPRWKPEWKGQLELWDSKDGELTRCTQTIEPLLGRLVIFSTTDWAYHGHPDPLECPEGITRKSIALYYWTNGRPENERSAAHSTIYKKRPQDPVDMEAERMRAERAKGRLIK